MNYSIFLENEVETKLELKYTNGASFCKHFLSFKPLKRSHNTSYEYDDAVVIFQIISVKLFGIFAKQFVILLTSLCPT